MITNARVLQPEFVPKDVVHRDSELNHLSAGLRPITEGEAADPAFISGPSGSGKTCIAKFTLSRLRENTININTQYVNCWEDYSSFKTLYRLLEGIDKTLDIHRQSTPTDVLLERLRNYDGSPYVVILDEVDQLEDKDILYDLHRMRNITLIMIANGEEEFFSNIDDRLTSRLQAITRVRFNHYSLDELMTILEDRVQWGLRPDVVSQSQLEMIADIAAGDARVAIGTLRGAARQADQQSLETITDDIIRDAVSEAKAEIKQKNVEKLTHHQEILYNIITSHGEITPGELYGQYEKHADSPKSRRMVRNYLAKMCHYNLIHAEGKNRGRTYQEIHN